MTSMSDSTKPGRWVCPVKAHRTLKDGELDLPRVEWRDGVAYCLTPGCSRSSVDGMSRR